jgi:DNA polymerase-3 subunit delta'
VLDIPPVLNDLAERPEWKELAAAMGNGDVPLALAAVIPQELAELFRDMYARHALCASGTGADGCDSCKSWQEDGHPDMIIAGKWGTPPGISDCIELQSRLYMKPMAAPLRLGVISSTEDLSLPAANSLLKITEDPPERGRILFIAGKDDFIPTIRSRIWIIKFKASGRADGAIAQSPPATPAEWAEWCERTKKNSLEEMAFEVECWVLSLSEREEWRTASSLENVLTIAQKRHLPVSMVQDALFALIREGMSIGQIFGYLREA